MKISKLNKLSASVSAGSLLLTFLIPNLANASATSKACDNLALAKFHPPGDAIVLKIDSTSLVAAADGLPEYCQVNGHLDTEINFVLNLPAKWNNKVMMAGNSGFAGDLQSEDIYSPLFSNYAAVATDTGHEGDASTLLNSPERLKNFEYRGVHLVALASKEITSFYYGSAVQHAYFNGCSRGGTQGMVEATKYPDDFDGIVSGAPSLPNGGYRLWGLRQLYPNGPSSALLPAPKLAVLRQYVFQKCDALDGVVDNIVEDPQACNFSPKNDLPHCKNDIDAPDCFTRVQINALEAVHQGPSSNGFPLGQPFYFSGVEGYDYGDDLGVGVDDFDYAYNVSGFPGTPALFPDLFDVGMPSFNYYLETSNLRYLVFNDPNYLVENFNFNKPSDVANYIGKLNPQMATNPNLSSFAKKGGKLLEWAGFGDSLNNPAATRAFYEAGVSYAGNLKQLKSYDRLFLIPGTGHCGNGDGPWAIDPVTALEKWVEKGNAPRSLDGFNPSTNLTRPVCAYPKVARLVNPSADPTVASSFKCVDVQPRNDDED